MIHATSTTALLHTRIGIGGTITLELFVLTFLLNPVVRRVNRRMEIWS